MGARDLRRRRGLAAGPLVLATLWLAACDQAPAPGAFEHPGGLHDAGQLAAISTCLEAPSDALRGSHEALLARARQALSKAPSPIAEFNAPTTDDAERDRLSKRQLSGDANAAFDAALASALDVGLAPGERLALEAKAIELIDAWASTHRVSSGSESHREKGHLVMAYVGSAFLAAADLIWSRPSWSDAQRERLRRWIEQTLRPDALRLAKRSNNKAAWGIFSALAGSHLLDDRAAMLDHAERLREMIDDQIAPDGTLPHELAREDKALWYTYFALAPLTHAAEVVRNDLAIDLFDRNERLRLALDQFLRGLTDATGSPFERATKRPPARNDWGANLLFAAGHLYDEPRYLEWPQRPLDRRNAAWKQVDLIPPRALRPDAAVATCQRVPVG